jgi:exodeoxyribonuclease III
MRIITLNVNGIRSANKRGAAWAKNVGWQIAYQILSPGIAGTPQQAHVYKESRFLDHAPVIMDYRL